MKLISLTDQEYNNLIKSNSLDDFLRFKETLVNSQVSESQVNNSLAIVKDHYSKVAIRILSVNEFNKYIVNGTCDGSVIANNTNTWHFPTMSYKNFLYTGSRSGGWINTSRFPGGYTESTAVFMSNDITVTIYSERFSNNSTSNSKYKFSVQVGVYNAYYYNPGAYVGAATVNYQDNDRSKTETYIYSSAQASHKVYNDIYRSRVFYYYVMHTFRPVFQIKDNDKSINLYS